VVHLSSRVCKTCVVWSMHRRHVTLLLLLLAWSWQLAH
jgi:hypothetical protein